MATKKKRKQITLHFDENSEYILDAIKEHCTKSFRTPEQEMIYALSWCIVKKDDFCKVYPVPPIDDPVPSTVDAGSDGIEDGGTEA